jgi:metal-responsive CopG/Arc/MetJ family transcriptional regulator
MKTAISLPDDLFDAAESLATRLGVSRSGLYAAALADYIARYEARRVSERLDAVYSAEASDVDARVERGQRQLLKRSDW